MTAPQLKLNTDNKFEIVGNFEFIWTPGLFYDNNMIPLKEIKFYWNPELTSDLQEIYSEDELLELLLEKLKQDFKNQFK